MPLEKEFKDRNVADQTKDPKSTLALNRALISLRHENDALSIGDQSIVDIRDNVLVFERSYASETFLVALNFGQESQELTELAAHDIVLSTHMDHATVRDRILRPNEGLVFKRR